MVSALLAGTAQNCETDEMAVMFVKLLQIYLQYFSTEVNLKV